MTPDKQTAEAIADTFTQSQIRDYRTTALKVKLEGGTITRSYEGSSFSISRENCEQIIADCSAALAIVAAVEAAETAELIQEPCGRGIDFSNRVCA